MHRLLLLAVLLCSGCSAPIEPAPVEGPASLCPLGDPLLEPTRQKLYGATKIIARKGYTLLYASKAKTAVWVCEKVYPQQLTGSVKREQHFQPDPDVADKAAINDYSKTGYDLGHLAAAGNQTVEGALKADTFLLTNVAPQVPSFNRLPWRSLENQVRQWVKKYGPLYVITGVVFAAKPKMLGKNGVWVPSHWYKLVFLPGPPPQALAFFMENKPYQNAEEWRNHNTAIDVIEAETRLDFLPSLSAPEEARLERTPQKLWLE